MLFIHPDECIDCGACVPACPWSHLRRARLDPSSQKDLVAANDVYRQAANTGAVSKAVAIVQDHVEAHPDLMAIDPKERQSSH